MIRVELMEMKDSKRTPGLESSIRKWELISVALAEVGRSADCQCGLCFEVTAAYKWCKECVYGKCLHDPGWEVTTYQEFNSIITDALRVARVLLEELRALRK